MNIIKDALAKLAKSLNETGWQENSVHCTTGYLQAHCTFSPNRFQISILDGEESCTVYTGLKEDFDAWVEKYIPTTEHTYKFTVTVGAKHNESFEIEDIYSLVETEFQSATEHLEVTGWDVDTVEKL